MDIPRLSSAAFGYLEQLSIECTGCRLSFREVSEQPSHTPNLGCAVAPRLRPGGGDWELCKVEKIDSAIVV